VETKPKGWVNTYGQQPKEKEAKPVGGRFLASIFPPGKKGGMKPKAGGFFATD